jgi:ligand-binding sensor protein
MPLSLRPVESWQLCHHGKKLENRFCALMAQSNKTCAACLEAQQKMSAGCVHPDHTPQSVTCFAGLRESSIPIYVGDEPLGYLQTGEVMLRGPSRRHFEKLTKQIATWGIKVTLAKL